MKKLLGKMSLGPDGIWGDVDDYGQQEDEKKLRQSIAHKVYSNYLLELSAHHSIPVMDREIEKFLSLIPNGGVVLDIGGCWGWHWRKINTQRPDITVVIVDLIRENLLHSKKILKELVTNKRIFLVHGNACSLKFGNENFDGVWSVQTTQHIPNFSVVCTEIFRVLKNNGIYWDYGLNNATLVRLLYNLFRKTYHLDGMIEGRFFLRRVNSNVIRVVKDTFYAEPVIRYSEILFTPDLGLPIGGKENSLFGKVDYNLTGGLSLLKFVARQCSFHVGKSV